MSTHHHIPFHIQTEIVKRIPHVKSLLRFRSVSKPWKSLIDSSKFIGNYKSNLHHLLVRFNHHYYVSVADDDDDDDDSFPQHNYFPPFRKSVWIPHLIGSSEGLFCFHSEQRKIDNSGTLTCEAIVWNPSIRKSVIIDVPDMSSIGFGVCPHTSDPKLVNIRHIYDSLTDSYISASAEIFTLSSGAWRSLSINLPNISHARFFHNHDHQVVIDGILYWRVNNDNENDRYCRIITFDLTSEEFGEVCLPDRLARKSYNWSVSKLNESLVVLEYHNEDRYRDRDSRVYELWMMEHGAFEYDNEAQYQDCDAQVCEVWMMEHGASNLFKKLFTIKVPIHSVGDYSYYFINGFRMNGQPIITNNHKKGILQVYDPCTRHINDHDLRIDHGLLFMGSYTETLLLLDQSNSIIH